MKRIIVIIVGLVGAIIMPVSIFAAPKCVDNTMPALQIGDPACYTGTATAGYYTTKTINCTWSCGNPLFICNSAEKGDYFSITDDGNSCNSYSSMCYDGCGNQDCENQAGVATGIANGTKDIDTWHAGTNTQTCYYLTVDTWGVCDEITGLQSATSVTQHSVAGTDCQNLNEETTRSCGVCNDEPTSAPYESLSAACKWGAFHSVQLFGGPPDGTLKWQCGTKGLAENSVHVGDFFANDVLHGDPVRIDEYSPTDKIGDQWCKCDTENKYICVPGPVDCTGKCGQKVAAPAIAYIEDTCFTGRRKKITPDQYFAGTSAQGAGKYCTGTVRKCADCGTKDTDGGIYHETN